MPIPIAPLLGFALGVVFAWLAAPELARDDGPVVASRPFAVAVAFAALVYTPIVGYFAAFHGDWSYLYVVAWRHVPSAIDLALVLFGGGSVVLGALAAASFVRRRRTGPLAAMIVGPGAVALALFALAARRLATNATYAQLHGDFGGEPIAASALGRGVLFMAVVLALGIAWCVRAIGAMNQETRVVTKRS